MGIVWIIERPKTTAWTAAAALIGDFPVRLFASLDTFVKLARLRTQASPAVLVVDLDDCHGRLGQVASLLDYYMPGTKRLFLQGVASLSLLPDGSYIGPRGMEGLVLSNVVSRLLGEQQAEDGATLRYRDVVLDLDRFCCQVLPHGVPESLPLKEARLLRLFMEQPGICLSREAIKAAIWPDVAVSARTVDSHISRLRKRLRTAELSIDSVYGDGYILK